MGNKLLVFVLMLPLIWFTTGCTSILNRCNIQTMNLEKHSCEFSSLQLDVFRDKYTYRWENGTNISASYYNRDWFLEVSCSDYKDLKIRYHRLDGFYEHLPRTMEKDSITIAGQKGEMHSYFGIDSTLGKGNFLGYRTFFLMEDSLTILCSISKYHYKQEDDTIFKKIIDSFKIIRK